jgi:hypothetical protein
MNSLSISQTQSKSARGLLVALGLILIVALLIPQLTWADHTDSDPAQVDVEAAAAEASSSSASAYSGASCDEPGDLDGDLSDACEFFNSLSASYAAGEITYNAPGR